MGQGTKDPLYSRGYLSCLLLNFGGWTHGPAWQGISSVLFINFICCPAHLTIKRHIGSIWPRLLQKNKNKLSWHSSNWGGRILRIQQSPLFWLESDLRLSFVCRKATLVCFDCVPAGKCLHTSTPLSLLLSSSPLNGRRVCFPGDPGSEIYCWNSLPFSLVLETRKTTRPNSPFCCDKILGGLRIFSLFRISWES